MFPKINLQYLISYLGITPYVFIICNKFFLFQINETISQNFIINYSIIIIVFIGAINWNLEVKINNIKAIYGFIPSFFAIILISLNLYNYNFNNLVIFLVLFFITQLILDYCLIYSKNINKKPFYLLRLSLLIPVPGEFPRSV